jgi:hypothetical protein
MDPLHVIDECAGVVDRIQHGSEFRGHSAIAAELEKHTCSISSNYPPASEEVDMLSSMRAKISQRRYPSHGRDTHYAFEDWLRDKQEKEIAAEIQRKQQAVASLCAQLARRSAASEEYRRWRAEVARHGAETTETPETSPPPPELVAEAEAANEETRRALFQQWRAYKDAAWLQALKSEQENAAAARAKENAERAAAKAAGAEAFEKWKVEAERKLVSSREAAIRKRKSQKEQRLKEKDDRKKRMKESVKDWLEKKNQHETKQQRREEMKRKKAEAKEREKQQTVALRKPELEKRVLEFFDHLQIEKKEKERREERERQLQHRLTWKKKAFPIVSSLIASPKATFR